MEDRQAYDTDLSDAEWDRLESLVPAPKPEGVLPSTRGVRSSMGYVTRFAAAAQGNSCRTICLLGVRSIITFGSGAGREFRRKSMTPCANGCGRRLDERAKPAARCWTASRCEPANKGVRVTMMGVVPWRWIVERDVRLAGSVSPAQVGL
jgi:hypothetical protein